MLNICTAARNWFSLSTHKVGGIRGVAVKCLDITKNSDCEGSSLERNWRWSSKVRVSNRIRYPGSPTVNDGCPLLVWIGQRPSESIKHPTWGVRRQRWNSKELTGPAQAERNMWFNSMIREEPYPGLNCREEGFGRQWRPFGASDQKVLYGCRQLNCREVWLKSLRAQPLASCHQVKLGPLGALPAGCEEDARMINPIFITSSVFISAVKMNLYSASISQGTILSSEAWSLIDHSKHGFPLIVSCISYVPTMRTTFPGSNTHNAVKP